MSTPSFTPTQGDAPQTFDPTLVETLHKKRDKPARVAALAVLTRAHGDHAAAYRVLDASRHPGMRPLIRSEKRWLALTTAADSYTDSSSTVAREQVARRFVYNVLRPLNAFTPARARKAKSVAATAAISALTDGRNFDTAILNQSDVAARWGVSRTAVRNAIDLAIEAGVITRITEVKDTGKWQVHRYRLRTAPSAWVAPEGTVESIVSGEPDELAQWLLSHDLPAWHFSDSRTPNDWLRVVETAAGLRKPNRATAALLLVGPSELDLDLDAVDRAAAAAKKRDADRTDTVLRTTLFGLLRKVGGYPQPGDFLQPFAQAMAEQLATKDAALQPLLINHIKEGLADHPPEKVALVIADLQKGLS